MRKKEEKKKTGKFEVCMFSSQPKLSSSQPPVPKPLKRYSQRQFRILKATLDAAADDAEHLMTERLVKKASSLSMGQAKLVIFHPTKGEPGKRNANKFRGTPKRKFKSWLMV